MQLRTIIAGFLLAFLTSPAFPEVGSIQETADPAAKPEAAVQEPASGTPSPEGENREPGKVAGPVTVLTGARILTGDGGDPIENGSIVIADGKIQAVGVSLDVPEGARRIDCSGLTVTAGLIDARSRLWIDPASAAQSGSAGSLDVFDALDPWSEDWMDVVRGGVTSVYLQPGGSDVCGGVGVVAATAPVAAGDPLQVLKRDAGLQAALGVGNDPDGRTRSQQFDRLKKLFADARKYQEDWKVWNDHQARIQADAAKEEAGKAAVPEGGQNREGRSRTANPDAETGPPGRGEGPPGTGGERPGGERPGGGRRGFGGRGGRGEAAEARPGGADEPTPAPAAADAGQKPEAEKPPTRPVEDPVRERLVQVLNGAIPVQLTVRHPDDARRALELAKEFGLRLVLDGIVESGSAAEDIRDRGLPVVLGPWFGGAKASRDLDRFLQSGMFEYEGRFAIATFGGSGRASGGLRSHAAQAVAAGCSPERALSAVTLDAATVLGIADQTGSVTVGKRADLAVFAGDPLDTSAPVQMTWVGGELVYGREDRGGVESAPVVPAEAVRLPASFPERYSLTSRRVMAADGSLAHRTVSVESGKIVANASADAGAPTGPHFDLGDAVISRGLFAAHSGAGLSATEFRASESDARHLSAADGFDPTAEAVSRLVESGVLAAVLVPPSQNTLAGRAALIRPGATQPLVDADLGDRFVFSAAARNRDRFPASLAGQRDLVLSLFADIPAATRVYLPEATRQLLIESRAKGTSGLLTGQRLSVFEAASDAEVHAALDVIETHRLSAAIFGVENVDRFASRLAGSRTILIVGPLDDGDQAWRAGDVVAAAAAGVPVLWTGETGLQMRRSAALAIAAGMNRETACRTLQGSGLRSDDDRADLVIWSGLPTDLRARPLAVIVDGKRVRERRKGEQWHE